jgi:hypothetical protein
MERIEGSNGKNNVNFVSEGQYVNWLKHNGGRFLVKMARDATERDVLLTLEEVKDAAASTDSFLMLETPTKFGRVQHVKDRMAACNNNRARAIEAKTTRSISSDKSVKHHYGDLQLINDGESVKFFLQRVQVLYYGVRRADQGW